MGGYPQFVEAHLLQLGGALLGGLLAMGLGDFQPLQFLEAFGDVGGGGGDLGLYLGQRGGELGAARDDRRRIGAVSEAYLRRGARDPLLPAHFFLDAVPLFAQIGGESLELGQIAALLIEPPAIEADEVGNIVGIASELVVEKFGFSFASILLVDENGR